jgi:hypothetical protein
MNNTIHNDTCTKCQNCGDYTNYADDIYHRQRMEELESLRKHAYHYPPNPPFAPDGLTWKQLYMKLHSAAEAVIDEALIGLDGNLSPSQDSLAALKELLS